MCSCSTPCWPAAARPFAPSRCGCTALRSAQICLGSVRACSLAVRRVDGLDCHSRSPSLRLAASLQHLLSRGILLEHITMVCLIVSPEGVSALLEAFPSLTLVAGMLDDHIDQRKFIVPGVGQCTMQRADAARRQRLGWRGRLCQRVLLRALTLARFFRLYGSPVCCCPSRRLRRSLFRHGGGGGEERGVQHHQRDAA